MAPRSVPSRLTRKDRERHARREEILRSARELFARTGYHGTTLEAIASHAEFGKGTIYNYFSSKEDLFYGLINQIVDEAMTLASRAIEETPGGAREKLLAYGQAMLTYSRTNADLIDLLYREIHHLDSSGADARLTALAARTRDLWKILAKPISAEMRTGRIRHSNPLSLAAMFDDLLRSCCITSGRKLCAIRGRRQEDVLALAVSVFFDGIAERKNQRITP
jgi:AcrR family transcriptional regulator